MNRHFSMENGIKSFSENISTYCTINSEDLIGSRMKRSTRPRRMKMHANEVFDCDTDFIILFD